MKAADIIFDEDLELYVFLEYLDNEICITLSEGLFASEEELTLNYKKKIASFINNIPCWYDQVCNSIIVWAQDTYKIVAHLQDIQLMGINVLFEQNAKELFGLDFRVEFDIERGCGVKIKAGKDKFSIIKIGTGDVAFSW